MVKRAKGGEAAGATAELEKKLLDNKLDEEEFIKPDEALLNDVLNEQEENYDENFSQEKDEELIEKIKSLSGKKRYRN